MIGRAAIGRPWLVAQIAAELHGHAFVEPNLEQRFHSLKTQILDAVEFYGPRTGVRVCRKHISAGLKDAFSNVEPPTLRAIQADTCTIENPQELISRLQYVFTNGPVGVAA